MTFEVKKQMRILYDLYLFLDALKIISIRKIDDIEYDNFFNNYDNNGEYDYTP